jgi:anti-anti-sigma regulatory factor
VSSTGGHSLDRVPSRRIILAYDASGITCLDEAALDTLARLLLAARRLDVAIELRGARRELVDLLTVVGLAGELTLEPDGKAEEREQPRLDEEVDTGDRPV